MSTSSQRPVVPPEALAQLRALKEAAILANQDKFRCGVCKQVHPLGNGVVVVARKNVLLGMCMECSKHTRIILQPMPNGEGVNIIVDGAATPEVPRIQLANLSDVRAVETSKLSAQRVEKTELGGNGEK